MKYFYLPGYYTHFLLLYKFIKYQYEHPEYFLKDRTIAGMYDLPTGLIWNGGRNNFSDFVSNTYNKNATKDIMNYWNNIEMPLFHTCTNMFIDTPELLEDELCNNFIKQYYKSQDRIIIVNPTLKQYLKDTYPNVKFINSTCLGITDIQEINKMTETEVYVINYNKNSDNKYLQQLKNKDNIEILCAEHCMPNCPQRHQHYVDISRVQLGEEIYFTPDKKCPFFQTQEAGIKNFIDLIENNEYRVPNRRIDELYDMGFSHFKIAGRSWNSIVLAQILIYYLIKPIYKQQIFNELNSWYRSLFV